MKENFWSELPRPFFILAPMEDVTDIVFRHVVSEAARPDVFFTEFTNTESFCHPEGIHSVRGRLTFSEDEHPMVAHIWGDKPEQFRETSIQLAKMGFKGIDLNMGCPVANVAKKGKGSGLILRPDVAAEIIQATKAGGLPVSVKTRLGYYEIDEWKDWLKHVFEQDIANLSIHLRTRKEMSKVDAHWELIEAIKNLRDEIAPNTLLTINGDIPDRKTGLELAEKYGIDGVMIGRGIFHNPFAFEKEPREHTSKELLDLLRLHLSLFNKYEKDEIRQFKSLRRFFKIYVRGIRGASELRHQLMNTQSIAEARALLDEFEAQMDEDVKIEL
ncbi:tRNA dihydrouridine synthase B [Staphylococcus aureus M1423]|jgi:tRNA-dihydrouridine synthase|uniref:Probable tRNA-dihydrouridine synthase n=58 Tax=Staphylococcus TaxID=1279 RepID=DUS_STAAM|nr:MULTISPECIES: tRNA-dihydrouridine synthase [Staphylococcus]P67716.1 RecName: Full=Probable tRNA-dihydrouridine synthase [Staphylococcus aureus subsp. aureus Mu50]P67717.1 RecName: Full=Probable tRNA-dihydrouridine synthase [Staphylococcus aureus subsp. aureus N315]EGS85164.1 dihydrouridine synthase (Dus) [Staphylococcus aureus subsp. aureus 21259]EHS11639.1 dihydrouridine synthase [Staphylococcus aureus subsp. aureus IS-99]ENK68825.1 tRNA dihydrouridine synthase B [Staphylococcus aureus M05